VQAFCPVVRPGSPPLTCKRLFPPTPLGPRGATRLLAGEGVRGPNSDDWRETLMLCTIIPLRLILSRPLNPLNPILFQPQFPSFNLTQLRLTCFHSHFLVLSFPLTLILTHHIRQAFPLNHAVLNDNIVSVVDSAGFRNNYISDDKEVTDVM
jgi:hypothetical protein